MRIAVVYWKDCPVGPRVARHLVARHGFAKTEETFDGEPVYAKGDLGLYCTHTRHVDCDHAKDIDAEAIVFATTHKSEKAVPMLSCHPIGNYAKARLGGREGTLVPTSAFLLQNYLRGLRDAQKNDSALAIYAVGMEATHHGPHLEKPCAFIEVGSGPEQWKDENAAAAVANVIAKRTSLEGTGDAVIGVGSGHYVPAFSDLAAKREYAFGHMCPAYQLENLDEKMLAQMVEKTVEGPRKIVYDKKVNARTKRLIAQSGLESEIAKKVK